MPLATPRDTRQAVFLHTGWRSGGTWMWSRCREQARVRALYEPLHEQLGRLRPADIDRLRPDSWASNHSETAPYFHEYGGLLRAGARGLPLHRQRFAFRRFFLSPDEHDDELEAYVGGLLDSAGSGQVSVLKFCRSLGRVGWMERRFPQALHAVVLRDPVAQFTSAQRLLATQRNRYFSVAPLMVLAHNARHGLVRQATAALGVRLPTLHSDDLAYVTETCWRHVKRQDPATRYRAFLAFWTATALRALQSGALLIDAGRMGADDGHRAAVEQAFGAVVGPGLSLHARPGGGMSPVSTLPDLGATEVDEAHAAAGALVMAQGVDLRPERRSVLLDHLGAGRTGGFGQRVRGRAKLIEPPSAEREADRSALQRLLTAVMVVGARNLQPLRRLHGRLTRRQGR